MNEPTIQRRKHYHYTPGMVILMLILFAIALYLKFR
jgi:hypothetical protein